MRSSSLSLIFPLAGPLAGALGLFVGTSLIAGPAQALLPSSAAGPQLELRDGSEGRIAPAVSMFPTSSDARRGLSRMETDLGARVTAMFHERTGIPMRAWGFSVTTPGASRDPAAAAKAAEQTLRQHLPLLAPGAAPEDFVLAQNHLDRGARGQRTVGFTQTWRGMPVLGGSVSFRFRGDRLFGIASDAFPDVDAPVPAELVHEDAARAEARAWVLDGAARAVATTVGGPFVLPMGRADRIEYRVVLRVRVEAESPRGAWDVYVDAGTGEPLARAQTLQFETAHIEIEAWERSPSYGERMSYAGDRVTLDLDSLPSASGESAPDGSFSFEGDAVSGTATLSSSHVRVRNDEGDDYAYGFDAAPGASIRLESNVEELDAQLNSFVHADLVNEYARSFAPDLAFLDQQVRVVVNIEDVCNAYSDGTTIHFYKSGSGCENTARVSDVVYHEYGHSIHAHAYLLCPPGNGGVCITDGALSEGIADYLAATITGDPHMGRGFFMDDGPLRSVNPDGREHVWPTDLVGEVHEDGLIIGGTLWDLRAALVDELGEAEGVAHADWLMFEGIRRAANIPEMYAEVLFADDDDGDLANGTPHECIINEAFGIHGLRGLGGEVVAPAVGLPEQEGHEVSIAVAGMSAACGESLTNAYMSWSDPSDPTRGGLVDMTVESDTVARGSLPRQPAGRSIRFDVRVENETSALSFPKNPADPSYQLYVGPVTSIACFDFETDPFTPSQGGTTGGWSHELVAGAAGTGADDWMWAAPRGGSVSGDPRSAFSGLFVVGQDLSPVVSGDDPDWNGLYQADKHTALISPVIDVSAFDGVRLQYRRWLNVEDAHFDKASILANWDGLEARDAAVVWRNLDSDQGDTSSVNHTDREWRFHDVDLTPRVVNGQVQVRFEMESDRGLEFAGWTLDDVCVVGIPSTTAGACPPAGCPTDTPSDDGEEDGATGDEADAPTDPAEDGCGCEAVGERRSPAPFALVATLGAMALAARRRRSR